MTRKSDLEYYAARLSAEREAAAQATSTAARRAHERLADHYAALLEGREPNSPWSEARPPLSATETLPISGI
jgi:DNA-binding GntR family transcriptional regulator